MAVLEPTRVKIATGATSLTITPPAGRAIQVFDIGISGSGEAWATLKNGLTNVGYFVVGAKENNHLPLFPSEDYKLSLLEQMEAEGVNTEYPVMEGDSFVVEVDSSMDIIQVTYREVEAGDVKGDEPNGKRGKERVIVYYGTNANAITSSGYHVVDKSLNPVEFRQFPFEESCPTGYEITIYGVGCKYLNPAGTTRTTRLRIKKNRETLFDPDENGFILYPSNMLPFAQEGEGGVVYFFEEPIVCKGGDEIITEIYVSHDGANDVAAESVRVMYPCKVVTGG